MSLFSKLKRRQRQEVMRAPRQHRNATEHGALDRWTVDDLMRDSPRFRDRVQTPIELTDGQTYGPSADVHEDLFLGAHTSGETRVRPAEEMRPSHRFGRDVIGEVFKTDEFRDSKPYMESDAISSALFTYAAADKLDELMRDESVHQQAEESQQQHEAEQRLDEVMGDLAGARADAKAAHDAGQPIPDGTAQAVKDLTGEREQLIGQLADAPDPGPLPTAVKPIAEQAAAEGKQRVDVWGAIAGSGAAELEHLTPDEAMALTEAWMQIPDFMELCKLLGRVQRDFRAQDARNVIGGDEEIVGVELGNNLTNTLPSELARLGNPLTQRSFLRDFQDESLLQFQTQGSEKVDMGPGVLCIDLSGSMRSASASGRPKHIEAKAVAVGFVRLMHRKRRDAVVICFNDSIMWEHHFRRRDGLAMPELITLASLHPTGGTDITKAVRRAEQLITSAPTFQRADVLVVTDGQADYTGAEPIRERFEKAGVRRHGIAIGHQPAETGWLMRFCDDAISVEDLTEATGDIVRALS